MPRADAQSEDDGYVLCVIHNFTDPLHGSSKLAIFDGLDILAGPVAAVKLRGTVAPGLHGSWSDRVMGPQDGEALPYVNDIRTGL